MKKTVFKNKHKVENYEGQEKISVDETLSYPPLFCFQTWTKSVPICVIYLLSILQIKFNDKNNFKIIIFIPQHRIHNEKPSMSIGRNYRLELEERLRKIKLSGENILNSKTLDERQDHIVSSNSKKRKSKNEPDIKTKKNNKSSGFVSLGVNLL